MDGRATTPDEFDSKGHRARLRQRLLDAGPAGFHDYELLEYLLALTIPRVDTKPLAKRLLHDFGGVGPLGIADDEIADLLRPQANAIEMIAGGDPSPLELTPQIMRRDRTPVDPDDGDRHQQQDEERERGERRHATQGPPANDHHLLLLIIPPLGHWATNPSAASPFQMRHDRFPSGGNLCCSGAARTTP